MRYLADNHKTVLDYLDLLGKLTIKHYVVEGFRTKGPQNLAYIWMTIKKVTTFRRSKYENKIILNKGVNPESVTYLA